MLRNTLAIIAGVVVGSIVNMGLVMLGHKVFPIEGIDPNNPDTFKEIYKSLDVQYFLFPFLAHALGSLVGAVVAYLLAANEQFKIALAVGVVFLIGGITAVFLIPAPIWFVAADLLLAYIPMAWLGATIALAFKR